MNQVSKKRDLQSNQKSLASKSNKSNKSFGTKKKGQPSDALIQGRKALD